jgi:hypothetical protein
MMTLFTRLARSTHSDGTMPSAAVVAERRKCYDGDLQQHPRRAQHADPITRYECL